MVYKASPDRKAKIITASIIILFAGIVSLQSVFSIHTGSAVPIITSSICFLIFITTFLYKPKHYELTNNQVIVHRLAGNVCIKMQDIHSVVLLNEDELHNATRTFGVYGMFGYYGKFYSFSLGPATWYATRLDTPVMITTKSLKKIILTPDEPVAFVEWFNQNRLGILANT